MGRREVKRGLIFGFAVLTILTLFLIGSIFFVNFPFASAVDSNITEDLGVGWIRNNPIYDLAYDSSRGLVYLAAGGGTIDSAFGVYNKSSDVLEDLGASEVGGNWFNLTSGNTPYALVYNPSNGLIYIGGESGFFGAYNRASNTTVRLTNISGDYTVKDLVYDPNSSLIYWAGGYGEFGFYNVTSDTHVTLNGTDTGDWLLSGDTYNGAQILAFAYDNDTQLLYLAGNKGKFGVYNRSSNVTTDLSGTDTGNWLGSDGAIQTLAYDSKNKSVYIGGGSASSKTLFGVYTRTSGVTENLNQTDPGNWIYDTSTYSIYDLTYSQSNGLVYLMGGGSGSVNVFGAYNRSTNITYDLRSSDIGDWIDGDLLYASIYDPEGGFVYLGSSHGRFGAYNVSSNTSESLKDPEDWISGSVIKGVVCDSNNSLIYFVGEGGTFGAYNRTANHREDLRLTDTGDWLAYAYFYATTYDLDHNLVYLTSGNGNGMFGFYNRTSNITANLTATDPGDWLGSTDLHSLVYDSNKDLLYLGGTYGKFGVYNLTSNITYDLRVSDTGDWIGSAAGNYIQSMTYDNDTNLVYLVGNNAIFGVYNRTSNVTTDLRGTDPGNWMGSSGSSGLYALTYDSKNKLVYVAGLEYSAGNNGIFGVYNRTSNVATDLSSTDTGGWIASPNYINALAYDSSKDLVYAVGTQGVFGVYNRTSNVMEDLRGTDTNDWIRTDALNSVTYDPITGLVYIVGDNGMFGAYNRSSNTTTIVEQQEEEEISEGGGTHPPTSPPTTTAETIPTASPGSPAVVNVNNSNMGLTQITVNVSQTVSNVSITITKLNSTQGAELRISLRRNGALYEAYDINATLSNQNISNVEINFKVNKTWLVNQNTTVNNVRLYRYVNNRWTRLTTTLMGQDSQFYYFSAISPGFSTFVVFFGEFECDPGETRCFENQAQLCLGNATWLITEKCFGGCENGECLETPFKFDLKTLYFVAGIIVVGLIVIFLLRRVPKGKNKSSKEVRSSFYHKQSLHKSR